MLISKLMTIFVITIHAYSVSIPYKYQPFVYNLNGITYGSNSSLCYKNCRKGQFCSIKNGNATCKPYCGDGIVVGNQRGPEFCDDGNQIPGDGCNKCISERLWQCQVRFEGIPSVCSFKCGNGILQPLFGQECDDHNRRNGDGCTANCTKIPSFSCSVDNNSKSICSPICGDGIIIRGQQCDDRNNKSGDGCSQICKIQKLYGCSGSPSVCVKKCGNGILDVNAGQYCDNGNSTKQDGCSNDCQNVTLGWNCNITANKPTKCFVVCGDGMMIQDQLKPGRCDDGNEISDDGCTNNCLVSPGWNCSGQPSKCKPICGDGKLVGIQTKARYCDDANSKLGDGCQNCIAQRLFSCTGAPSVCVNLCGNKRYNPVVEQQCDNGNTTDIIDDGCSNLCKLNKGWNCTKIQFALSVCTPICGDKLIKTGQGCDDGNLLNGDGCSSLCKVQKGYNCASLNSDGSSKCVKMPAKL